MEKYVQKGLHSARASKTLSRRGFSFYFSVTSVTRIRLMVHGQVRVNLKVDDALRLNLHNHVDDLINYYPSESKLRLSSCSGGHYQFSHRRHRT